LFALDQKEQQQLQESKNGTDHLASISAPTIVSYESEAYEEYSRSLSPRKERKEVLAELQKTSGYAPLTWSKRALNLPLRAIQKTFPTKKNQPGKLILLRCGESTFNANGTFTGWLDPDLTTVGVQQCRHAAQVLKAEGFEPDVVYTSRLTRAIKSTWYILEELDLLFISVHKTMRLNQRMYGALQGLSREETAAQVGEAAVHAWRNSLKARPPQLALSDPAHPRYDRRYADLAADQIPSTESLLDCQERARPLWEHKIKKDIADGKTVLVVAHRDALRGLVKSIDDVSETDIEDIRVPKCIPFIYKFEEVQGGENDGALMPVPPDPESALFQEHSSARLLETPASLKAAVSELAEQTAAASSGNSSDSFVLNHHKRDVSLREALSNLRSTSPALNHTEGPLLHAILDDDEDINIKMKVPPPVPEYKGERWNDDPSEFEEFEYDEFDEEEESQTVSANVVTLRTEDKVEKSLGLASGSSLFKDGEPFVVLIRHGRTPHNNLGLFTGWEDPPLAEGGVQDAINAGKILKRYNTC